MSELPIIRHLSTMGARGLVVWMHGSHYETLVRPWVTELDGERVLEHMSLRETYPAALQMIDEPLRHLSASVVESSPDDGIVAVDLSFGREGSEACDRTPILRFLDLLPIPFDVAIKDGGEWVINFTREHVAPTRANRGGLVLAHTLHSVGPASIEGNTLPIDFFGALVQGLRGRAGVEIDWVSVTRHLESPPSDGRHGLPIHNASGLLQDVAQRRDLASLCLSREPERDVEELLDGEGWRAPVCSLPGSPQEKLAHDILAMSRAASRRKKLAALVPAAQNASPARVSRRL
ncbi:MULTISPECIES: hypothetical protein [unclassified Thioalkalivibrio]|uniref:hypothetical protein n=1 Tax=unclassified Thioalkalivibrio TaxID=2621013 RepID=UPI000376CBA5|nr:MULTISPECIES: hypothetical protein [unclassified Thioalkalivibrio]